MGNSTKQNEVNCGTPLAEPIGSATVERWEAYRAEMIGFEARMRDLSKKFLEIPAYKEAAECAMRADAMRFVIGRMPNTATEEK